MKREQKTELVKLNLFFIRFIKIKINLITVALFINLFYTMIDGAGNKPI